LSSRQARARIPQGDSASGQSWPSQPRCRVPGQDAVELAASLAKIFAQVLLDGARAEYSRPLISGFRPSRAGRAIWGSCAVSAPLAPTVSL